MIETFLKNNWRTVTLGGVVVFAWFVWPTPYEYFDAKDGSRCRQNRFNQKSEVWWGSLQQWRTDNQASYNQAKKESEELRKSLENPILQN